MKIIIELTNKYGIDPKVDELNEFINYKSQARQGSVVSAALKYYLKFRWRNTWQDIDNQLVKARIRPTIREKNFLTKQEAIDVLHTIKNKEHQLIAKIQYFTGARATEVICIKKINMKHEVEDKRIRINIIGKGDKVDPIYLTDNLMHDLNDCIRRDGVYLFLKNHLRELPDDQLRTKAETYYKRYYDSLRKAADECELNIATHDWRRSFAQSLIDEGSDVYDVQLALRHKSMDTTERYFKNEEGKVAKTMLRHQQGLSGSGN